MKEKILKIIKEVKDDCPFSRSDASSYGWDEACDAIEQKLSDYSPWVSVEDRLPEEDGNSSIYCLVFDRSYGVIVRPFNEYHNCWDDEDGDDAYCVAVGGEVTHWMPLPEPPKAK